jgi:NTP pyrophosphatase (non-canonical NTP hydrolase)
MINFFRQLFGTTTSINPSVSTEQPIPQVTIDNLIDYRKMAIRTLSYKDTAEKNNFHMIMGFVTEIGEAVDAYKKFLIYNKKLDIVNVSEEISDAMWYLMGYTHLNMLDLPDLTKIQTYRLLSKENFTNEWEVADELILILQYFLRDPKKYYFKTIIKLYYLSTIIYKMSNTIEVDFYMALEKNIKKLMVRFPNKYNDFNAQNRNLSSERQTLNF